RLAATLKKSLKDRSGQNSDGPAAISPPVFLSGACTMPIKIPDQLPAREVLTREGVAIMDEKTALRQDIRPLQIGLLNLMPNKMRSETQFARLIGTTPLQVELTLVRIGNHKAKNTPEEHLIAFYQT